MVQGSSRSLRAICTLLPVVACFAAVGRFLFCCRPTFGTRAWADLNEAITDEQAGDRLLRAIQGKGAFRRFKDELRDEYPDLLSARQVFRDARAQRAARPSREQKKRAVAWEASCPAWSVSLPMTAAWSTFRRSTGWPVISAMRSKSLSTCRTVSPASSAVAAMIRPGVEGARCWPRSASSVKISTARSSMAGVWCSTGMDDLPSCTDAFVSRCDRACALEVESVQIPSCMATCSDLNSVIVSTTNHDAPPVSGTSKPAPQRTWSTGCAPVEPS
jgi:hypothetical protein